MAEFDTYPPDMNHSSLPAAFASPSAVFSDEKVKVPKSVSHYYEIAYHGHQQVDIPDKPNYTKKCRTKTLNYLQYMERKFGNRYCENCDLGFYSLEEFEFHLTSHSKCPFANCDFVGSIDALEKHVTYQHMLHESASRKIDANRYRQERLNNFPSSNKQILKEELLKKKKERGELFGLGENKKRLHSNNKNFESREAQKRPRIDTNISDRKVPECTVDKSPNISDRKVPECTVDKCPAVETVECDRVRYRKRRPSPFRGIGDDGIDSEVLFPRKEVNIESTERFDDFDISDEEETTNLNESTESSSVMSKPLLNVGGLGSLMNYGSESEEDSTDTLGTAQVEDESKCVSNIKVKQSSSDNKNKDSKVEVRRKLKRRKSNKSSKSHEADDSVPTEESKSNARVKRPNLKAPISHHRSAGDIPITELAFIKEEQLARKCVKSTYRKFQNKFKESLLSKLLKDEIRHERNLLLQCTRYIVVNNFFEQKR